LKFDHHFIAGQPQQLICLNNLRLTDHSSIIHDKTDRLPLRPQEMTEDSESLPVVWHIIHFRYMLSVGLRITRGNQNSVSSRN
jgi:hypothetical protein